MKPRTQLNLLAAFIYLIMIMLAIAVASTCTSCTSKVTYNKVTYVIQTTGVCEVSSDIGGTPILNAIEYDEWTKDPDLYLQRDEIVTHHKNGNKVYFNAEYSTIIGEPSTFIAYIILDDEVVDTRMFRSDGTQCYHGKYILSYSF